MPFTRRQLAAALALIALGWAQLFGMTRGYLCDCSGTIEITAFDHCHGPHGHEAHAHSDAGLHHQHHDEEDVPADSDTHHHPPVKETVVAQQIHSSAPAVAMAAVLMAVTFPDWLAPLRFEAPPTIATGLLRDDGGGARRWPQMLTHAIALRV